MPLFVFTNAYEILFGEPDFWIILYWAILRLQ